MSLVVDIEKQLNSFNLKASFQTEGGTLGILGSSGCGKSMTLKCIAGVEKPDKGRIILNGVTLFDSDRKINLPPQNRQVGYLFQNYALFPNMTVMQNIECGCRNVQDKKERIGRVREIMELLRIDDLSNRKPAQLSGGQQQRVALARILVGRPGLIMLDEPFSALDSHLRMRLQIEMKERLSEYGKEALMVTHSRDEAYHMCDHIAVMDSGRIETIKETKELFADPGTVNAAILTGCKNILPVRKTGEYEVEVLDWNLRLTTAVKVPDDVCSVGIRAHYFNPKTPQNRFHVNYVRELEEPFEWVFQFRVSGQSENSEPIWWRLSKEKRPQQIPDELGIAPVNVLLLRK